MMFSMEKCLDRSGTGTAEEAELFAGGGEGLGKEGSPSDDVASAVAAVSDEIGDILKDELGDADRADRIGAELADLSAELGLLAGLADGEPQQDFPSLFEIAMGHRGSGSGSSSSSWSGGRGGRPRRHSRPQRAPRRRPIAKGKEMSRRRSAAARRAVCMRVRRVEVVSDASDVGADSDSDDQWTELDDASGSSDSSSLKEAASVDVDCNGYQHKASAEAPAMGQFLLPLLSTDAPAPDPEHFLIRHEDILQLLASAEETVREDIPLEEETPLEPQADILSSGDTLEFDGSAVSAEEEAALLHYVCGMEAEHVASEAVMFAPVEEWLLGVFHSWCEISALMFTLIGTNMSVEMVTEEWVYRARFGCHCRLCLCLANNAEGLVSFVRGVVCALARAGLAPPAARLLRHAHAHAHYAHWDIAALRTSLHNAQGAAIIHEQLCKLAAQSEITQQIVHEVCQCRQFDKPMEKEYAVERFCKILENFKAASTITFKVEMIPAEGSEGTGGSEGGRWGWVAAAVSRLERYLRPHQRASTRARLADMAQRTTQHDLSAWSGYKHRCDCLTPRTLCAQQRKQLLSGLWGRPMFSSGHLRAAIISFFGMMEAVNEFNGAKPETSTDADKAPSETAPETASRELQQGDGTGAKPPEECEEEPEGPSSIESMGSAESHCSGRSVASGDSADSADSGDNGEGVEGAEGQPAAVVDNNSDSNPTLDLDDLSDSDANSGTGSLGLSTSSSLDSASELLLAAAAAVESGGSEGEAAPGELCRTVRHLMRSIASIERLMDRVLKHCDEWPAPPTRNDHEARKRVDMGLSEVDRKLMAMYRRLPEVHRRQLQVYRKQKKLSTVCMQLVGGVAPAPPPPGSPPPAAPHQPCRPLCPEYHLQRFKEVRRKVMHMRDQQLYYHRLRMWLEDQLRQERESLPESNVTLIEELPRRKRRTSSPKVPRLTTAPKRKLKPASPSISKPHKILQMLKHKAPAQTTQLLTDAAKIEAEPPEAFPLEREDNISDTETIVGEKEIDMCKEMKECLAKFSNFALNSDLPEEYVQETKYPESVSPPLQEMSPTTPEPMPVYSSKPSQRLLSVNKFLNKDEKDFNQQITPEVLNIPLNARRTPLLVKDEKETITDAIDSEKDPNIYKYVSFGLEIKKAMEECQNIINSYNSIKDGKKEDDGQLSLEQICEVMMSLDKNSTEFLIDNEDSVDRDGSNNTKLSELVENMPQILANMPEIASKLSEFANASFELPEIASIMSGLPEVNSEAQLTPETLKQIRELKLNKTRDSVKVTKNTTKRKSQRRIKNNIDSNDIIGTMTFELDNKDLVELIKDEKDLQALMKNKSREDFKDLLFSISAQVVINKVFEYLKQNKSPVLAKCLEEDKELFSLPKNSLNSEMYSKASTLFDNSVKDALSMEELRDLVKSRFNSWKHYVASKFKGIPVEILENEIEAMLDKFYSYIQDLAGKNFVPDPDRMAAKLEELRKHHETHRDSDSDSRESVRQILLTTSVGNTLDILIMKFPKLTHDKKVMVKGLKFKYMNVLRRCCESQPLANWILTDPETAINVIQDLMDFQVKKPENVPEFSSMANDKKRDYFIERLRDVNKQYMETLPKNNLSGDEWLVMLYKLEQYEEKLKENFNKISPPTVKTTQNASEAEILAAKGLSKIIGKASIRVVKKPEPQKKRDEKPPEKTGEDEEKRLKNELLLAKCEAILTTKGEKSLLDSFYTIKSYITQGLPVPETYKKHVISICSSIDAKLLDEEIEETLRSDEEAKEKTVHPQNTEDLAKYSAQALRNAKQTLNAVAFKNLSRNGQSKSESEVCDTPKNDCKWTNDCVCNSCKDNESVCLGDIVKQCYDDKKSCDKKSKEVKKPPVKAKPVAKACENVNHQQHVCKVGHSGVACAGEGTEQPCTCCYCTVFGHAPPLTTPVPRNFNETRERLRSILNKKKQQCKNANGETEPPLAKATGVQTPPLDPPVQPRPTKSPAVAAKPPAVAAKPPTVAAKPQAVAAKPQAVAAKPQAVAAKPQAVAAKPPPVAVKPPPVAAKPPPVTAKPPPIAPKPPALPKSQPPRLSAAQPQPQPQSQSQLQSQSQQPQSQQQRVSMEMQQRQLADKMARMIVHDDATQDNNAKTQQRTVPVQVNVPILKTEGKVNPNAMEQIRLQQLKQQQQAQYQQLKQQQQKAQLQQQQQQQVQQQQKKPEPIYDLPIHNKPTLTPQQQQQIRHQQHQQLIQQKLQEHQHQIAQLSQHPPVLLTAEQQHEQQQQQQQDQQQQTAEQYRQMKALAQAHMQRQSRQQQHRGNVSLSSRDTSVFSTSSGCSGGSCWRGSRPEDTRDLDALLQYIEGPARHVDRGKKRAKKQRQKAKKMESRLLEERNAVVAELSRARRELDALQVAHAAAKRRLDHTRQLLQAHSNTNKKKGKKQKLNPAQQAKVQLVAEQLGELTTLMNTTSKEMQAAEKQVLDFSRRLQNCERQLAETRAVQGKCDRPQPEVDQTDVLHKQHQLQQQQLQQHQQQLQQQQQLEQQRQLQLAELEKQKIEKQKQSTFINAQNGGLVCVRRSAGDGAVTVSIPGQRTDTPLAQLMHNNKHLTILNVCEEAAPATAGNAKPSDGRKQTWEQALAHINQLAKGANKEKKKHKEPKEQTKPEQKSKEKEMKEQQRSNSLPETQPLSKKQRKLLAKQQAEEEEKKKQQQQQQQEAKSKKPESKKAELPKPEPVKKTDKKPEPAKKETKTEKKKEKAVEKKSEKKGKENKQEKAPEPKPKTSKQPAAPPQQQQATKKDNKKQQQQQQQQQKPQVINITPDTTIEVVSKKTPCPTEVEKPASCSIMEQLSCGVQVADLKLPPGITLTRVQPSEKKEPPPIKSVPLWKAGQLPAAPTPVARPAPVINADPSNVMFTTAVPEPPKPVIIAEPPPVGKSKKAKKKAKKAAAADEKPDGTKIVTLRNPMFHPNLPPVQITNQPAQKKQEQIRIPDPIPMPPNACQATITPTSNGMYTIRNPLMTMMHQQSLMGVRTQSPQMNPMYPQPFTYVNPNTYVAPNPNQYVIEPTRASPKPDDFQTRIMNLASFTQKNDEGYSLFKTPEDHQQRSFLSPEYYETHSPKSVVSPNPIGTRPVETNRPFESDSSLFANPIQRPEPIGTPLKREEERMDYIGLYTPFGQEDRNVFRNALFSDKSDGSTLRSEEMGVNHVANGDTLPYFQRLRVGSKLNNEVTIHHVTESKFYKGQEQGLPLECGVQEESLFSRPAPPHAWTDQLYGPPTHNKTGVQSARSSPTGSSVKSSCSASGGASPPSDERRFGPVGARSSHPHHTQHTQDPESSVFLPDSSITNLSSLEVSEREIESFKRFDFYFEPPQHKPKVQLDVRDIAAALRQNHK